jgi:hypothetical protein
LLFLLQGFLQFSFTNFCTRHFLLYLKFSEMVCTVYLRTQEDVDTHLKDVRLGVFYMFGKELATRDNLEGLMDNVPSY